MNLSPLCIVVGGTGGVGSGLVEGLLAAGCRVVVPSRSPERLEQLRLRIRGVDTTLLDTVVVDLNDTTSARNWLEVFAQDYGDLHTVFASIGGGWKLGDAFLQMSPRTWDTVVQDGLLGHVHAARLFLNQLVHQKAGNYVMINGIGAERPHRGILPMNVVAAAQDMLFRGLQLEVPAHVHIHQLMLGVVATHAHPERDANRFYTAREVGDYAAGIVTGKHPGPTHRLEGKG